MTNDLTALRNRIVEEMIGHAYRQGFDDFLRDMDGAPEYRLWEAASSGTPDPELGRQFRQKAEQYR